MPHLPSLRLLAQQAARLLAAGQVRTAAPLLCPNPGAAAAAALRRGWPGAPPRPWGRRACSSGSGGGGVPGGVGHGGGAPGPAPPRATKINYDKESRVMRVEFEGGATFSFPAELLRVESPGADNQAVLKKGRVARGRSQVGIMSVEPVGSYAVRLVFDDLHSTGIYSWGFLHELGRDQEGRMQRYLARLEQGHKPRPLPPASPSVGESVTAAMGKTLKAIFWDLDDTLIMTSDHIETAFVAVIALAKEKYPSLDGDRLVADFRAVFGTKPWDKEYKVPVFKWRANMWLGALKNQGYSDAPFSEDLQDHWDKTRLGHFPWLPGVPEMIRKFEAQGIKCCLITNGHHVVQREKLTACKAGDLFTWMLVGGEEVVEGRKEKPDAGIFFKACRLVGCEPHEAVHVGDSLSTDVLGGINAGMAGTVWVTLGRAAPGPGKPQPTWMVDDVTEVPEVLRRDGWKAPGRGGSASLATGLAVAAAFAAGFAASKMRSSSA